MTPVLRQIARLCAPRQAVLSRSRLKLHEQNEHVPEATAEALKSELEAAGIDAAGQGPLLEVRQCTCCIFPRSFRLSVAVRLAVGQASQFLLRQAAKTDEAKRIDRLKPMG